MEITQALVKSYFDYRDGFLYWKIKRNNRSTVGKIAGCVKLIKDQKRRRIRIFGSEYQAARLIFLYHNGYLPEIVDHENHNTLDDRIDNLRAADIFKNNRNRSSAINSTSKYLGVYLFRGKWKAGLTSNGISIYGGTFSDEIQAALAYNRLAIFHHGEFANLNII